MQKLAVFGGEPSRKEPFPVWPRVKDHVKARLITTFLEEGWGIGSAAITRFDAEFAKFHDAAYCLSTSSGTAALWVALKAAGVKAGDEVIVPAYTFIATASAVLMANAVPVFVDIDPDTLNINPVLIRAAVTPRTKVILPVHIGGNPAEMDEILDLGHKLKINVIEDAAQAHGAEWKGRKVGA
ncbi:MAG: DegT/DnrJ/EryC1/StrS family aminotransferase, partial [Candidatus Neomarinimicrobiota bacterium]